MADIINIQFKVTKVVDFGTSRKREITTLVLSCTFSEIQCLTVENCQLVPTPVLYNRTPSFGMTPFEFRGEHDIRKKTTVFGLSVVGEEIMFVLIQYQSVTDEQTDGRTDGRTDISANTVPALA